mmetsp:Transcript_10645/g.28419  ORF Transcript_10645/g.28419 Transcript_10645/m.28419 type:complete len:203 (-) Transcript_10645:665-1273(-)
MKLNRTHVDALVNRAVVHTGRALTQYVKDGSVARCCTCGEVRGELLKKPWLLLSGSGGHASAWIKVEKRGGKVESLRRILIPVALIEPHTTSCLANDALCIWTPCVWRAFAHHQTHDDAHCPYVWRTRTQHAPEQNLRRSVVRSDLVRTSSFAILPSVCVFRRETCASKINELDLRKGRVNKHHVFRLDVAMSDAQRIMQKF